MKLRAPVETSDKYRQLLKRGGRCCVCLHKKHALSTRAGLAQPWFSVLGYRLVQNIHSYFLQFFNLFQKNMRNCIYVVLRVSAYHSDNYFMTFFASY